MELTIIDDESPDFWRNHCAWCGGTFEAIEHRGDGTQKPTQTWPGDTSGPWPGRGTRAWRALYFNLEADVDFCSAKCSTAWSEARRQSVPGKWPEEGRGETAAR